MWLHRILGLALTVGAAGTLVSSSPVNSQPNPPANKEPNQNHTPSRGNLMRDLNLSTEQIDKLKEIRQTYHQQIVEANSSLRTAQQELTKMMTGSASVKSIRDKYQEVVLLKEQLNNLRFASMLEMREVLTPTQRAKLAQLMEQNRDRATPPQGGDRQPFFQFFNPGCSETSKTEPRQTPGPQ